MLVIPAIDLKNGRCVRLVQGDPDRETVYSDDPVSVARRFVDAGARLIHVVDLDGAFQGVPVNAGIVEEIARAVPIPIEIGGGIRSAQTIERYLKAGIGRVILGTAVIEGDFDALLAAYRDAIIVGLDARDGMVATRGWKAVSSLPVADCIDRLKEKGIKEIIFTDISTDGMLSGPNYTSLENVLSRAGAIAVIASGGISTLDDIRRLAAYRDPAVKGCIVGKSIYDGRIDLADAIEAAR
ncbi:MAG TPA: 1-(5-phosphoribosyl)-5-[(5-phosphoribosylamino)methylideneamino]imidazole-4-carboxamide isomerase [Spirochaetota bacterium]|nr:1-(5-phosphoribosyl)-5-[(5-phosphoribosylamino)methylideneamino]imidazole-4-carboxamide isomerase [Spirochaetota bacterium]